MNIILHLVSDINNFNCYYFLIIVISVPGNSYTAPTVGHSTTPPQFNHGGGGSVLRGG